MSLTWNDLFLKGSIFNLQVARWPARSRITTADLGIEDSTEVETALVLGSHRLIPREAFADINAAAGRAKRAIDEQSLPFGLMWGARYVPEKNMAALGEKLKERRAEFYAAVEAFIEGYEQRKADMMPVIKKALQNAAQPVAAVVTDGVEVVPARTKDEVAAAAFERLISEYPPADIVRGWFELTWNIYAIQGARDASVSAALRDEGVEVKNAIAEMAKSLRDEVTGKLADVLGLIQRGGKLKQISIDAALAVLDHVEAVNVLDDALLTKQVRTLRAALKGINVDERVPDATVASLSGIKTALETDLASAVAAAERKLTGAGARKLKIAGGKAA